MWIEISLTVNDGELAEAVADVLGRTIQDGIFIQATGVVYDPDSEGRAIGPYRVCGYLPNDETLESARSTIEHGLWHMSQIQPLPPAEYRVLEETNWVDAWKQHYRPIAIGRRLMILPAWEQNPQPGKIPLLIDPGMAFGTGTHPTTQLALEFLEGVMDAAPVDTVFDIGCGSGILAIAAAKLGAQRITGVDVDEDAIDNARLNAELNGVAAQIDFGLGSVAELRSAARPVRQADLVVANILTHILVRLLDDGMADLVAPGGALILSGILAEREPEMLAALEKHRLSIHRRSQMGDWVALRTMRL